jgi:hypothetical protein
MTFELYKKETIVKPLYTGENSKWSKDFDEWAKNDIPYIKDYFDKLIKDGKLCPLKENS